MIGFRGLRVGDPDRFALELVTQLLSGQGGRLFLELRDRRSLAYSVAATNLEGVAPGTFTVYIATAPEKRAEAEARLLEQLDELVQRAPAPGELERAQRFLVGNFAIDQQRNAVHAAHVSLDALYGLGRRRGRALPGGDPGRHAGGRAARRAPRHPARRLHAGRHHSGLSFGPSASPSLRGSLPPLNQPDSA